MFSLSLADVPFVGSATPIQRALAVLRKFGTDAHVWLPGVGSINGLQTANYLLSDASTGLAPVDQYVGRASDALGGLGVDILGTVWQVSAGASVVSGTVTLNNVSDVFAYQDVMTPGATYKVDFAYTITSGASGLYVGTNSGTGENIVSLSALTGSGVFSGVFRAGYARFVFRDSASGCVATFTNISVREVTGIDATQPTTANKPKLVQTNNKYAWVFDGVNDSLALSSVPFQMSDDHCVIAAGVNYASTGDRYLFDGGNTVSSNAMVCSLAINNTQPKVYWRDDAVVNAGVAGVVGSIPIGSAAVISARKRGTSGVLRLNGLQVGVAATVTPGVTTCTHSAIGVRAFPGNYFNGNIGPVIAIKGTVSDSDLLLLEKLVGALSGVAIP